MLTVHIIQFAEKRIKNFISLSIINLSNTKKKFTNTLY